MRSPDAAEELRTLKDAVDIFNKTFADDVLHSRSDMIRFAVDQGKSFIDSLLSAYRGLMSLLGCINLRNISVPPTIVTTKSKLPSEEKSYGPLLIDDFERLVLGWQQLIPELAIQDTPPATKGKKKPSFKDTNALIQPEWKTGIITKSTVRRPLFAEYEVTCAIRDTVYLDFISNLKEIVNDSCDMHTKFLLKNQRWWDQFQQQVDSLLE